MKFTETRPALQVGPTWAVRFPEARLRTGTSARSRSAAMLAVLAVCLSGTAVPRPPPLNRSKSVGGRAGNHRGRPCVHRPARLDADPARQGHDRRGARKRLPGRACGRRRTRCRRRGRRGVGRLSGRNQARAADVRARRQPERLAGCAHLFLPDPAERVALADGPGDAAWRSLGGEDRRPGQCRQRQAVGRAGVDPRGIPSFGISARKLRRPEGASARPGPDRQR